MVESSGGELVKRGGNFVAAFDLANLAKLPRSRKSVKYERFSRDKYDHYIITNMIALAVWCKYCACRTVVVDDTMSVSPGFLNNNSVQ